jgi:hypothetical protein
MAESNEIEQALRSLPRTDHDEATATRLAEFLRDVASAWREATQKHRNKLAKALFESVWVNDQTVLGVTLKAELKPFFDLQYSGLSNGVLQWRPRPDSNRQDRLFSEH